MAAAVPQKIKIVERSFLELHFKLGISFNLGCLILYALHFPKLLLRGIYIIFPPGGGEWVGEKRKKRELKEERGKKGEKGGKKSRNVANGAELGKISQNGMKYGKVWQRYGKV